MASLFISTTTWDSKFTTYITLFVFLLSSSIFISTEAYDALDPNGNITIKWDIMSWTADGYVATVTLYNFQQYRHIEAPGWQLGWTWTKKEVIWNMVGGQATEQGDCSKFKGNIPHCCKKNPTVVDLLPGTSYNQQVANCCKGGVLSSWAQDPANAVGSFQISVGSSGTTNKTVRAPKNVTLKAPGPGYTCGRASIVKPSRFTTSDKRRVTQALSKKLNIICCWMLIYQGKSPHIASVVQGSNRNAITPLVQCTSHMCPIRVHWHVKVNYKEYWRVKVTITNFNYASNYSQWNLVVQHPNFENLTQIFSFKYKSLTPYASINDTGMLWGIKFYNDLLMQAGPKGNVQSELLFRKDKSTFSFEKGWAFPQRIYFNGDNCVMPPPDAYPMLPNAGSRKYISLLTLFITSILTFAFIYAFA
ncbi:hypothetical protein L484_018180 [Morus notabilis]|uniref:COBRA-like protein n=1 Tax=Morus notabilis TaxID=981085 RepID=W9RHU0_9ROSA|nr:hypothetical protein L484_018180 [Morus notabilis]